MRSGAYLDFSRPITAYRTSEQPSNRVRVMTRPLTTLAIRVILRNGQRDVLTRSFDVEVTGKSNMAALTGRTSSGMHICYITCTFASVHDSNEIPMETPMLSGSGSMGEHCSTCGLIRNHRRWRILTSGLRTLN